MMPCYSRMSAKRTQCLCNSAHAAFLKDRRTEEMQPAVNAHGYLVARTHARWHVSRVVGFAVCLLTCLTRDRVCGVRHKGVLRGHNFLAQHRHLQRIMGQPCPPQAQHGPLIPFGGPDLLDGAPRALPLPTVPCKPCKSSLTHEG